MTERRRRRPTTACSICRRRKTRCNRESPCSNCVRSRRKEECVYESEPSRSRRQTRQVHAARNAIQTSPVSAGEALAEEPNFTAVSHPSSNVGLPSTTTSTIGGLQTTPSASDTLEAMKSRIRQLEAQVYKAPSGSTPLSSVTSNTNIETAATRLTADIHIHREESRLFGRAALVSRSISHKTRLFGQSHWMNSVVPLILDTVELIDPHLRKEDSRAVSYMHKCKILARAIKAQRAPSWPCPPTTDLPTRELADKLIDHYLQTIESVHHIVHIPTFREQYAALWDPPEPKSDQAFLVQVKLVLALGAVTYDDDFSLRMQAIKWIYEAQAFLSEPIFKSRLRIQTLQTRILLLLAEELVDVGGDSVWISAGSLIRTAITMGLHRDPSHLPKMEPLTREMRRRLWNTIMEISLQASLAKGCPPLISCSDFDTQGPSRFEDEYLTADPADVPYESNDVNRRNLIANALRLTFPVRLKVVKLLNDLESGGGTYEDALKLDVEVRAVFKELRGNLQACRTDNDLQSSNRPDFAIQVLDVIMHRYLSSLHMPFFGISLHESAYAFSRKIVIDTAIKIWCATWPSTSINSADIPGTSTTANENNLFPRFVLNGSGFFRTVAVQAACVISAELIAQLQEDQGLSPTPLRRDLLSVMEEAKTWHLRSIQSGETSAKGHLLATLMAAQLEGLRKGLDRGQLGRFLVEATERSGEISLPILEGLERTTRAGHMRQGVNGTGPPVFEERSDILPGLTGEWDFTMPDAIFTDSDGSPDWSFGVGTMQGLSFW